MGSNTSSQKKFFDRIEFEREARQEALDNNWHYNNGAEGALYGLIPGLICAIFAGPLYIFMAWPFGLISGFFSFIFGTEIQISNLVRKRQVS